jgi:hypothetical protein
MNDADIAKLNAGKVESVDSQAEYWMLVDGRKNGRVTLYGLYRRRPRDHRSDYEDHRCLTESETVLG